MLSRIRGFTLFELLIVIAITSLMASLVGPMAFSSLERVQAKDEMLRLKQIVSNTSKRAFVRQMAHDIYLDGNHYSVKMNQVVLAEGTFDYITAHQLHIHLNAVGLSEHPSYQVLYKDKHYAIELRKLDSDTVSD
ncbi:type II secretion system protein [Pseudoalteromonas xiamenensis]|uniref:type II secretion system protein n=1 Tax=Pseudoalteromonas xiamenensis TaxID=882626 RepID=UPI0035F0406C